MVTTRTFVAEEGEMLWFCESCGTNGLRAKSQRECPNCGAAQNPATRYFPGNEGSIPRDIGVAPRAAAPDWICNFCGAATASKEAACSACGAGKETSSKGVRLVPSSEGGETAASAKARIRQSKELLFATRQAEADAKEGEKRLEDPLGFGDEPDLFDPRFGNPRTSNPSQEVGPLRKWPPELLWFTVGAILLLVLVLALTCSKEETLRVEGVSWQREIAILEKRLVTDSDWCSSMPSDALVLSTSSRVHHTNRIQTGESCHNTPAIPSRCSTSCANKDLGDGSFQRQCKETCTKTVPAGRSCTPIYTDDPVYESWCNYSIQRWRKSDPKSISGQDMNPAWPITGVSGCETLGCTREGDRSEIYRTILRDEDGRPHTCTWYQAEGAWSSFTPGTPLKGTIGSLFHNLDCGSLRK
jgi:hypothetical protein